MPCSSTLVHWCKFEERQPAPSATGEHSPSLKQAWFCWFLDPAAHTLSFLLDLDSIQCDRYLTKTLKNRKAVRLPNPDMMYYKGIWQLKREKLLDLLKELIHSLENRWATKKKVFSKYILPSCVQLGIKSNSCNLFQKLKVMWCCGAPDNVGTVVKSWH